jgi:hypothetical protein
MGRRHTVTLSERESWHDGHQPAAAIVVHRSVGVWHVHRGQVSGLDSLGAADMCGPSCCVDGKLSLVANCFFTATPDTHLLSISLKNKLKKLCVPNSGCYEKLLSHVDVLRHTSRSPAARETEASSEERWRRTPPGHE